MGGKLRIAICDDLKQDRILLCAHLELIFEKKQRKIHIDEYNNGLELLSDIGKKDWELIFLDIIMGEENGISIAHKIREANVSTKIIFVTTSMDYMLDSYGVYAYYYFVKPVLYESLSAVTDHFLEEYDKKPLNRQYLVRNGNNISLISYQDMEYIESNNTAITFHLTDGTKRHIYGKLSDVLDELNDARFLRCHQSYIVNMDHVRIVNQDFHMSSGAVVLIRKKEMKKIREQYFEYLLSQGEDT